MLVLALVAALTVSSFGCIPSATGPAGDDGPTTLAADATGTETGMDATDAAGGPFVVSSVYFSQEASGGERLVRVDRQAPAGWSDERTLDLALREWLEGPTAAEKARGLWGAAPAGTKLLGSSISDGVATVDLPASFAPSGGSAATMNSLGQLIYTATGVKGVRAVKLMLGGKAVAEFGGEGFDVSKPLARSDVSGYFVK